MRIAATRLRSKLTQWMTRQSEASNVSLKATSGLNDRTMDFQVR
jgi:hypothetical protein